MYTSGIPQSSQATCAHTHRNTRPQVTCTITTISSLTIVVGESPLPPSFPPFFSPPPSLSPPPFSLSPSLPFFSPPSFSPSLPPSFLHSLFIPLPSLSLSHSPPPLSLALSPSPFLFLSPSLPAENCCEFTRILLTPLAYQGSC